MLRLTGEFLNRMFWRYCATGLLLLLSLSLCIQHALAVEYSNAPVAGSLTSSFGWRSDPITGGSRFHAGIDIAAPLGSPVYVPQGGVVIYSGVYGGYGNVVVVQHTNQLFTLYGHNSYLLVSSGQTVQRGQVISLVGSTGRSTGPHLHFEVHQGSGYVNPFHYLSYLAGTYGSNTLIAHQVDVSQLNSEYSASTEVTSKRPVVTIPAHRRRVSTHHRNGRVELISGTNVRSVGF